tara:strand:- start:6490 stop:7683 length:1194 start_codon:yes stop_codon:yes gene_type:complete
MEPACLPKNELSRLSELKELKLLDTVEEDAYDAITHLAASICKTPIALVSLVDIDRQWFKSHHGLDARETPRELAFCSHAILQKKIFVIEDATKDPRFLDNPLVIGAPNVIFYAGVPLITRAGHALGTLCVIDNKPGSLSKDQLESLHLLAAQVVSLFELRKANNDLVEVAESRTRFLNAINHEMRTPLNIMSGYLDLIAEDATERKDNETLESCNHARSANEQLLGLVRDMIEQTASEAGELTHKPVEIDINQVIQETVRECRTLGLAKKINFQTKSLPEFKLKADPMRMKQILHNLLSNAVKYGSENSTVAIEVDSANSERLDIRVSNTGTVIGENEKSLIFERYYRSPKYARSSVAGFGLGLPIAKQLAQLQGGDLVLESSVNSMTTFLLQLKV